MSVPLVTHGHGIYAMYKDQLVEYYIKKYNLLILVVSLGTNKEGFVPRLNGACLNNPS